MRPCVRGTRSLGFIRIARAGHASLRARCQKFRFYTHCARGTCVPACADAQRLGFICTARAGNASLRARMPNVLVLYALRARGMRPCVRGFPTFRVYTHFARGGSAHAFEKAARFFTMRRVEILPSVIYRGAVRNAAMVQIRTPILNTPRAGISGRSLTYQPLNSYHL